MVKKMVAERIFLRNDLTSSVASETSIRVFINRYLKLAFLGSSGTLLLITDVGSRYIFQCQWNLEFQWNGRLVQILRFLSHPYVCTAAIGLTSGFGHALYEILRKHGSLIDAPNPAHMAGSCLLVLLEDGEFLDRNLISHHTCRLIFFFSSVAEGPLLHSMLTFINFIDGFCCRIIYPCWLSRPHYGQVLLVYEADQLFASVIWHLGVLLSHVLWFWLQLDVDCVSLLDLY